MAASDWPSNPFQANMILLLKSWERKDMPPAIQPLLFWSQDNSWRENFTEISTSGRDMPEQSDLDLALPCAQSRQECPVAQQPAGLLYACAHRITTYPSLKHRKSQQCLWCTVPALCSSDAGGVAELTARTLVGKMLAEYSPVGHHRHILPFTHIKATGG